MMMQEIGARNGNVSEESSRDILFHQETMPAVTIDVPAEIAERFETLDDLRRTVYEDFVIEQRQRGNISLGRAAELLGISYRAFFDLLGEKGLSFINASPQERDESYHHFHQVMSKAAQ